jgi:hypothetical protein
MAAITLENENDTQTLHSACYHSGCVGNPYRLKSERMKITVISTDRQELAL